MDAQVHNFLTGSGAGVLCVNKDAGGFAGLYRRSFQPQCAERKRGMTEAIPSNIVASVGEMRCLYRTVNPGCGEVDLVATQE